MSQFKYFIEKLNKYNFPENVINHAGRIIGYGFFPGSSGCLDNSNEITRKKVLIIGQDQDNEVGFEKTMKKGDERYSSTWNNLLELLKESNIDESDCFFTNFILGIRKKAKSNVGKSPSMMNVEYLKFCSNIMIEQIEFHRPIAIICLGLIPFKLLGLISNDILVKNIWLTEFKEIDIHNLAINDNISFETILDFETNVGVIYHPSYRKINVSHRKYKRLKGNNAEINILIDLITKDTKNAEW